MNEPRGNELITRSPETGVRKDLDISENTRRVGAALKVNSERIERTLRAEVLVVSQPVMAEQMSSRLLDVRRAKDLAGFGLPLHPTPEETESDKLLRNIIEEDLQVITSKLIDRTKGMSEKLAGVCIPGESADSILIKDDVPEEILKDIKDHEVIHALARNPDTSDSGFNNSGILGADSALNEASTELLRLHAKFPDLSTIDLYQNLRDGKIQARAYNDDTLRLACALAATHFHDDKSLNPVTVEELNEWYQGKRNPSAFQSANGFLRATLTALPEKYKPLMTPFTLITVPS